MSRSSSWPASSIRGRLAPGSYHAKRVASEALVALSRQRHPRPPATPLAERVRTVRRYARRAAWAHLRRREWPAAWRVVTVTVSNVRAIRAQAAAAAACAELGHVTYLPDRSCPSFPACAVCVRCGDERHARR